MRTVCFYSNAVDVHCQSMAWALRKFGVTVNIVSLSDMPDYSKSSWSIGQSSWMDRNSDIFPEKADLLYLRRYWPTVAPDFAHPEDIDFIQEGCDKYNTWLVEYYGSCGSNWVQTPQACRTANNKLLQLRTAKQVGLSVPRTLVSNDYDEVRRFLESEGPFITKPIVAKNWLVNETNTFPFTAKVDLDDINEVAVSLAPMIYQTLVPKKLEHRIAVFGETIVSASLNSHRYRETETDWRTAVGRALDIQNSELPEHLEHKLKSFMRILNLRTGVFDFIETPDGEFVFLEVNESGQFLFIEGENPNIQCLLHSTKFFLNLLSMPFAGVDERSISLQKFFDDHPPEIFTSDGIGIHKTRPYANKMSSQAQR
ncbi:MAG: hypothetical protein AAGJ68_03365 [Pseudomonadota bacterium]